MTESTVIVAEKSEIRRLVALATQMGRKDCYTGKRKTLRMKGVLWMEVTFDPGMEECGQPVSTHDISDKGVSFWLRKKLEPGGVLYLRDSSDGRDHPWVKGRVTHCTTGLKGFLIGCGFEFEE